MTALYVVIDDKKYPDITYSNENPNSCGEEVMNLEDAKYTAQKLGAKVYKLGSVDGPPLYTGTGSDYLDCVLGIGGFESYDPIKGVKGLTDE
jgi:hypothetical protein